MPLCARTELRSSRLGTKVFVGVPEFSAEAGTVLLPEAVMRALGVRLEDAGEKVVVRYYPAPKVRCLTPSRGAGV